MLTGLMLGAILLMTLFPNMLAARAVHRCLVEQPLRRLAAMDRRHILYALVMVAMAMLASELILILGSADLALAFAWDLSLYVDALAAAWAIAAATRARMAWLAIKFGVRRLVAKQRARPRARRQRAARIKPVSDGPEDDRGWAYAFA